VAAVLPALMMEMLFVLFVDIAKLNLKIADLLLDLRVPSSSRHSIA
jgi:hypothetical protein